MGLDHNTIGQYVWYQEKEDLGQAKLAWLGDAVRLRNGDPKESMSFALLIGTTSITALTP